MSDTTEYAAFLDAKITLDSQRGLTCEPGDVNPLLKPHQRDIVCWAVAGGRRGIFTSFGLGKTMIQLETVRIILARTGGRGLIAMPLGVRQEFIRDAAKLGIPVEFVRSDDAVKQLGIDGNTATIFLTNYESIRENKLDPRGFNVVSLDEAAILRGFGGTKTFRELMRIFEGTATYRFVATATPSPNEYIELLSYAAFLDIMDVAQAKTRFFKRDATHADKLTIHPHKVKEFWLWVASWAMFLQRPSDLGYSDEGYELPPLDVRWHEVGTNHRDAGEDPDGQLRMIRDTSIGVSESAREKRESLPDRITKLMEIRAEEPDEHRIIWHDLEAERYAIEQAVPTAMTVYGTQDLIEREQIVIQFSDGQIRELAAKPVMLGAGTNLQRYCARAVFLGIGFKFNAFIQAIHRIQRFLQERPVRIDLIYTEAEQSVRKQLERKWRQHTEMVDRMSEMIREYGLSHAALRGALTRTLNVERQEESGPGWRVVLNDAVLEMPRVESDSVGLILTSIPFSTQYEYSPSYNDFGHTQDVEHFFRQMDFLTPELYRSLKPGRLVVIHVKDRVVPSGLTGLGFQTVQPFHADCISHYTKHGFGYMGMKTIVTDVVRENNQTYRLGWTEQLKDGSKMGCGMPEYLLLFRKPPTDRSNGYADEPVVKGRRWWDTERREWDEPDGYSLGRWQLDAHGFQRSSGDRLLTGADIEGVPHHVMYKLWKKNNLNMAYDYEAHVKLCESLTERGALPVTFMLFPPHSWHPDVWSDVARMRTLNSSQQVKGKEMHLCLARGSLVLTRDGHVPIEEVEPGDEVLTHRGRWRKVLVARMTSERREVIAFRAQGVAGFRLTADHNVWTRQADGVRAVDAAVKSDPEWIEAANTVGHYVNAKLPPIEPSELTHVECWLIGRWLADGHIGTRGDYWVSVGPSKLQEFEQRAGVHAGTRSVGTAVQIRLKGLTTAIRTVLMRCGRGAGNKLVPGELLTLPTEMASAVLDGYLSGDGHVITSRDRWQATSISRALLLGVAMLVQRVYGTIASLSAGRPAGTAVIQGRTVMTRQEWSLSFNDNDSAGRKRPFVLDDGAWKRVRSADPAGTDEVWCLTVDEDASFTVEGCIVKNCPMQIDTADRVIKQMSNPGDIVMDPFAGLGTVPLQALKAGRMGVGIELSPTYWRDAVTYLREAEQAQSIPMLFDLLSTEAESDVSTSA